MKGRKKKHAITKLSSHRTWVLGGNSVYEPRQKLLTNLASDTIDYVENFNCSNILENLL